MSWFCLKASWMSCTLASSIENPRPVTAQCDPDDNIGRRIRSSDEKRQIVALNWWPLK